MAEVSRRLVGINNRMASMAFQKHLRLRIQRVGFRSKEAFQSLRGRVSQGAPHPAVVWLLQTTARPGCVLHLGRIGLCVVSSFISDRFQALA